MKNAGMLLAVFVGVAPTALKAVPIPCVPDTLANYIVQSSSGGCFIQDKLYTGFSYTGGGAVLASQVRVTPVFKIVPPQNTQGLTFTVDGVGGWSTGFAIVYTVTVVPSGTANLIATKLQANLGVAGDNPATVQSVKSNGVTLLAGFNIALGSHGKGQGPGPKCANCENVSATFDGVETLTSVTTVTVPPGGFVFSIEEVYLQDN